MKNRKRSKMTESKCVRPIKLAAMSLMITLISLGGWLVENVFMACSEGYIDNRNMMLPFLFGYGLAVAGIYVLFGTPTTPRFLKYRFPMKKPIVNLLLYCAIVFTVVSVGECLTGLFVERFFNITWWDYSGIPLHITQYTSVPTSAAFTAILTLFMQFAFERLYAAFHKIDKRILYPLAIVLMLLLTADFIASGIRMYQTENFVRIWRIDLWS